MIARVRIYLYVCCGDIVLLLEIFVGAHLSFDRLGLKFTFGIGPIYMMYVKILKILSEKTNFE